MASAQHRIFLKDSQATEAMGAAIAACCTAGSSIHLLGDLGAGKSTLVRGFLHSLGHRGPVKSPTYTLVEGYELSGQRYYHFDLYRLGDPEELEYLGIRDYFDGQSICLLEWPQRGEGLLPAPSLVVELHYYPHGNSHGREAILRPGSSDTSMIVDCINRHFSSL